MICIGIRWCRIVPNGREREREACVHIIFKIEKELKPRVPPPEPPLFLYIRRCLFFFILLLFGRVLMLVCVYPPIFSLLLCVCVDGDPPLVLPWRYYFRPFHPCAFIRVGPLCGGFGFLCNPHTHSSWKEEDSSIHFSIPPSPSHLVILYLGKAALLCTWLISNQLWPPTTSSSSSYHHFKQIFFVLFWFPKVRNDRFSCRCCFSHGF